MMADLKKTNQWAQAEDVGWQVVGGNRLTDFQRLWTSKRHAWVVKLNLRVVLPVNSFRGDSVNRSVELFRSVGVITVTFLKIIILIHV